MEIHRVTDFLNGGFVTYYDVLNRHDMREAPSSPPPTPPSPDVDDLAVAALNPSSRDAGQPSAAEL